MQFIVGVLIGAVGASVAFYLVYQNNKKKVTDILNLDPKATWEHIRQRIKEKL